MSSTNVLVYRVETPIVLQKKKPCILFADFIISKVGYSHMYYVEYGHSYLTAPIVLDCTRCFRGDSVELDHRAVDVISILVCPIALLHGTAALHSRFCVQPTYLLAYTK